MAALILPSRRVVQPQGPVEIDWGNPLAQGLLFALNPAAGERNLALPKQAIALSPFVLSNSTTGRLVGTGASEYEVTADLDQNLTLFSVWRSRESSQYLAADSARSVFSARNAGNTGWTWGRPPGANAVAGGATGNLTRQGFTLNGIADYQESNTTIESLVDSPVAVRYIKSTGAISWYNKGKKSSPDTTASTAGTNGGNLVFRRQGPFASNLLPFLDRTGASFVWNRGLSDSEIGQVSENPWQLYRPIQRRIWVPVAVDGSATGSLAATEVGSDTAAFSAASTASGSLAATETGSDTSAIAGQVTATGSLAATEAGSDTAAISGGNPAAIGSMAAQEVGSDTASISGIAPSTGTLTAQETGADTASIAGASVVAGSLAATEVGSDSFFATSGAQQSVGTLAAQEVGSDTASASGAVTVQGTLTATESGGDSAIMTGETRVMGLFAATETGQDVFSGTSIQLPARTGSMAATETGADGAALSGQSLVMGLFTAQEVGSDVFFASENDLTRIRPIQATYNTLAIDAGYNTIEIDPTYWID